MKFTAKGIKYQIDMFGVVHQVDIKPYVYDAQYSATYDTPEYKRQSEILQAMRLTFAGAAHGRPINSLQDIGFGNGAFMKFAKQHIKLVGGKDVTGVPVPEGCFFSEEYEPVEVITFFDCLEHIPNLMFVRDLPCETVVISLPFCHIKERGIQWFENEYFHLKKDEHLHHFDADSLTAFMDNMGWYRVAISSMEDLVRKRDVEWNILTAAFKRKKEVWKDVVGEEGRYQISSFGRVKSMARIIGAGYMSKERILKPQADKNGYLHVSFPVGNRKSKSVKIHKLVANAFHPNYEQKKCVNHKNSVIWHNYATNLEWNTHSENCKHGFQFNGREVDQSARKRPIVQMDMLGNIVKVWASGLEMEQKGGYDRSSISKAIKLKKSYYGSKWAYA